MVNSGSSLTHSGSIRAVEHYVNTWELVHLPGDDIFIVVEGDAVPVDIAGGSSSQGKLQAEQMCTIRERVTNSQVKENEGPNLLGMTQEKAKVIGDPAG